MEIRIVNDAYHCIENQENFLKKKKSSILKSQQLDR